MTGYTVHTGTTIKFSEGWDRIFPGSPAQSAKTKTVKTPQKKSSSGSAKSRVKTRAKRAAKSTR